MGSLPAWAGLLQGLLRARFPCLWIDLPAHRHLWWQHLCTHLGAVVDARTGASTTDGCAVPVNLQAGEAGRGALLACSWARRMERELACRCPPVCHRPALLPPAGRVEASAWAAAVHQLVPALPAERRLPVLLGVVAALWLQRPHRDGPQAFSAILAAAQPHLGPDAGEGKEGGGSSSRQAPLQALVAAMLRFDPSDRSSCGAHQQLNASAKAQLLCLLAADEQLADALLAAAAPAACQAAAAAGEVHAALFARALDAQLPSLPMRSAACILLHAAASGVWQQGGSAPASDGSGGDDAPSTAGAVAALLTCHGGRSLTDALAWASNHSAACSFLSLDALASFLAAAAPALGEPWLPLATVAVLGPMRGARRPLGDAAGALMPSDAELAGIVCHACAVLSAPASSRLAAALAAALPAERVAALADELPCAAARLAAAAEGGAGGGDLQPLWRPAFDMLTEGLSPALRASALMAALIREKAAQVTGQPLFLGAGVLGRGGGGGRGRASGGGEGARGAGPSQARLEMLPCVCSVPCGVVQPFAELGHVTWYSTHTQGSSSAQPSAGGSLDPTSAGRACMAFCMTILDAPRAQMQLACGFWGSRDDTVGCWINHAATRTLDGDSSTSAPVDPSARHAAVCRARQPSALRSAATAASVVATTSRPRAPHQLLIAARQPARRTAQLPPP